MRAWPGVLFFVEVLIRAAKRLFGQAGIPQRNKSLGTHVEQQVCYAEVRQETVPLFKYLVVTAWCERIVVPVVAFRMNGFSEIDRVGRGLHIGFGSPALRV